MPSAVVGVCALGRTDEGRGPYGQRSAEQGQRQHADGDDVLLHDVLP